MDNKKKLKFADIAVYIILFATFLLLISAGIQKLQGAHHPKIFGYGMGLVLTGSMEPNLPEDSFIIIKEQQEYQIGDIITYNHKDNISVTHRIHDIDTVGIVPKGDANTTPDAHIKQEDIVGKVIFQCKAIYFFAVLILGVAGIIIASVLIDREEKNSNKSDTNSDSENKSKEIILEEKKETKKKIQLD
jgi:signal peptidase